MGAFGPPWTPATLVIPNPPAATPTAATVSAGQLWHILSIRWAFASSAGVGTRNCSLYFIDVAGHGYAQAGANLNQGASQAVVYAAYFGAALMSGTVNGLLALPLPDLVMNAGDQMQLFVAGLQAGDQQSNIVIQYEYISYG